MSLLSTSFQRIPSCSDIEIETHLSDMLNVLRLDIIPRNPAAEEKRGIAFQFRHRSHNDYSRKRVTYMLAFGIWVVPFTNCETQK